MAVSRRQSTREVLYSCELARSQKVTFHRCVKEQPEHRRERDTDTHTEREREREGERERERERREGKREKEKKG